MQSLRKFPDPFLAEICGQPDALRRAAAGLVKQRPKLERVAAAAGSPPTIVLTGMGASYHSCYPAVPELARHGIGALHVDTAELLHFRLPLLAEGALLVAVSQSGRSAEVVRLSEAVRSRGRAFLVAVTNGSSNPLAEAADVAFDTHAGTEHGPSTGTFASSLVALSVLAGILSGGDPEATLERTVAGAESAADGADHLLDRAEGWARELRDWQAGRATTVLLGRGPARAASEIGALLLKESAGLPAEALQAAQFRHGPLELAGPDLAAVVVATEPETSRLDLALASDLVDAGSAVLVVGRGTSAPPGSIGVDIGPVNDLVAPAVSIVPVQLLAWRLGVDLGRSPGQLTRASKVTTDE
jgi:glutamine---fructose-6-phosphate transaminase (isomerizing)